MSHCTAGQNIRAVAHSYPPTPTQIHECTWRSSGCGVIPQTAVLFTTPPPPRDHSDMGNIWREPTDFPELRGRREKTDWFILWHRNKSNPSCCIHWYVHVIFWFIFLLWEKINYKRSISSFFWLLPAILLQIPWIWRTHTISRPSQPSSNTSETHEWEQQITTQTTFGLWLCPDWPNIFPGISVHPQTFNLDPSGFVFQWLLPMTGLKKEWGVLRCKKKSNPEKLLSKLSSETPPVVYILN